jgi:hypothetical protein
MAKKKDPKKIIQRPVPSFANKARVFTAIDEIVDIEFCPELNNFLSEIKVFIDSRIK